MIMKCRVCGEEKDITEFTTDKYKKFGVRRYCKLCNTKKNESYYQSKTAYKRKLHLESNILEGENYHITKAGVVINRTTGNVIKQCLRSGYPYVTIWNSEGHKKMSVHRLLAIAYIPNPENKPFVNHIDGKRDNNSLSNLEWVTSKENAQHAIKTGLFAPKKGVDNPLYGKPSPNRKAVVCTLQDGTELVFGYAKDALLQGYATTVSKVHLCCSGSRKTHNGYTWRFLSDL